MNNYEVVGAIGTGSFGAVTKVRRKADGRMLVWKEINYGRMTEREKQQLVTEVNVLRELNHGNVVRYYDRIIDKVSTKIYIVMEYCEGGDLGKLIKKTRKEKTLLDEDLIWRIFMQIVLALHECHIRKDGKILHRDLKPSSIFLDSSHNVKLGNFGLARVMTSAEDYASTQVGTPFYMSPEQLTDGRYNEKSDIWSAGCILYEMAALSPPFEGSSQFTLATKIKAGRYERVPATYSEEMMRVIGWMLTLDPAQRPTVADLLSVPQVSVRLREKRLSENAGLLRKKEEEVRLLEAEIAKLESELAELSDQPSLPPQLSDADPQDSFVIECSFVDGPLPARRTEAHRSVSPLLHSKRTSKVVNRHSSLEMPENKENPQAEPRKSGGWLVTAAKAVPRLPLARVNK